MLNKTRQFTNNICILSVAENKNYSSNFIASSLGYRWIVWWNCN